MSDLGKGCVLNKTAKYRPASDAGLQYAKRIFQKSFNLLENEVFENGYFREKRVKLNFSKWDFLANINLNHMIYSSLERSKFGLKNVTKIMRFGITIVEIAVLQYRWFLQKSTIRSGPLRRDVLRKFLQFCNI